jgi:enoyl-[acyl-carrier protein] reductase I
MPVMPNLLQNKTVIILGVWNKWSIAYAIAQACIREGATVLLTYQNERAKPTVEELGKELGAHAFYPCDVQQQSDIDGVAASVKRDGHKLDAVVHCLAFANHEDLNQPFLDTSRDGFKLALDVSAYSLVAISKALSPLMTDGGAIMTLTYLGSTRVVKNYNVMGIAKAALEAEVRYLAAELGAKKIRVNAISAGPIKTISARGIKDFSKVLDFVQEHSPLRRNTDIAEVADTAVFLASDLGRGVTGNCIYVDAGFQIMGLEPPVPPAPK